MSGPKLPMPAMAKAPVAPMAKLPMPGKRPLRNVGMSLKDALMAKLRGLA